MPTESRELLAVIDEESARMNQLIGKAFDMSRLEAGDVKLELASHPVHELISRALDTCRGSLRNRPIQLEVPDPDAKVVADASLIENVLVHLIENANLYSPERAPITVAARSEDGLVWFSVGDRGPGIRESEMEKIFEKFYRGEEQRDQVVGSGMGLSIVKAIVQAHGGSIEVVNLPARGAEFTFSLPADRARRPNEEPTPATSSGTQPTDP